jgi:hypothetical protein
MAIGSVASLTLCKTKTLKGSVMIETKTRHDGVAYKEPVNECKERTIVDRRARCDRRTRKSKGSAYITIVGWICRREKTRRKNDRFDWAKIKT